MYNYIEEANSTASNQYHGDLVARRELKSALIQAIDALIRLDHVKKALFYGKVHPTLASHEIRENCYTVPMRNLHNGMHPAIDSFHGIIGIATEAGELLEALYKAIEDDTPVDNINLIEETGDVFWYVAVLAKAQGFTFEDAQARNIAKLRERYPEKFNEHDATARNLEAERKVLSQTTIADVIEKTRADILGAEQTTVTSVKVKIK